MDKEEEEEDTVENIYDSEYRDSLIDNDEIDSTEAGFMDGYEMAGLREEEE